MDLESLLKAIPSAAESPLALAAYALALIFWTLAIFHQGKLKALLKSAKDFPESQRIELIKLEYKFNSEQEVRDRNKRYLLLAFIVTLMAIIVVLLISTFNAIDKRKNEQVVRSFNGLVKTMILGKTAATENRIKESLAYFKASIEESPTYESYINLGMAYDDLGYNNEAVSAYKQAIQIDSNRITAYLNLGPSYIDVEKYDDAEKILNKAHKLYIKSNLKDNDAKVAILNNLGMVYLNRAQSETEITIKRKFADIAVNDYFFPALELYESQNSTIRKAQLLNNLGMSLLILDRFKEGKDYLKVSLSLKEKVSANTSLGIAYFNYADYILKQEGKFGEAQAYIYRASEIFIQTDFAIGNGEVLRLKGDLSYLEGDIKSANQYWTEAGKIFSDANLKMYHSKVNNRLNSKSDKDLREIILSLSEI